MTLREIYANYKELVLVVAGAIAAVVVQKLLPWLGKLILQLAGRIGGYLVDRIGKRNQITRFEARYLGLMVEEHRWLKVRGIRAPRTVSVELSDVYVSLSLHRPISHQRAGQIEMDARLDRMPSSPPMWYSDTEDNRLTLSEVFRKLPQRMVVLGGPGTGKTTLLSYVALAYARNRAMEQLGIDESRLPILIPLAKMYRLKLPITSESLSSVCVGPEIKQLCPEGFLREKLEAGTCVVLFDGMDEVTSEDDRRKMVEELETFVCAYPRNRYIVTSRPAGYSGFSLSGFTHLELCDFTDDDIRSFAHQWCKAVELATCDASNADAEALAIRHATERATDLVSAIESNKGVRTLTVNPLLLTIVAMVHGYRIELPRRRVELYDECAEVLLGHWDKAKGIAGRLDASAKRRVLEPLAHLMHTKGLREIEQEAAHSSIRGALPRIGEAENGAADFLREVRERSGLLVERSLGLYGFPHLTFQEYLTARFLADRGDKGLQELMQHLNDSWWQEVILLYAGMKDATDLIKEILSLEDNIFADNLFLAVRCVLDALTLDPATELALVEKLIHVWQGGPYEGLRIRARRSLRDLATAGRISAVTVLNGIATSGLPNAIPAIELVGEIYTLASQVPPVLKELINHDAPAVRAAAVEALAGMRGGDESLKDTLLMFLGEEDVELRSNAACALGRIGVASSPVLEILFQGLLNSNWKSAVIVQELAERDEQLVESLFGFVLDNAEGNDGLLTYVIGEIENRPAEVVKRALDLASNTAGPKARACRGILGHWAIQLSSPPEFRRTVFRILLQSLAAQPEDEGEVGYWLSRIVRQEPDLRPPFSALIRSKDNYGPILELQRHGIYSKEEVPVGFMIGLLDGGDGNTRAKVATALRDYGTEDEAISALRSLLDDAEDDTRARALLSLIRSGQRDAALVEMLVKLCQHEDAKLREMAARGISECVSDYPKLVSFLFGLASDEAQRVRNTVSYQLTEVASGRAEVLDRLFEALQDTDDEAARAFAAETLEGICDEYSELDISDNLMAKVYGCLNDERTAGMSRVKDIAWMFLNEFR